MSKRFDKFAKSLADRLTDAQVIALYQVIDPISDQQRAELDKLSDDDLLRELTADA